MIRGTTPTHHFTIPIEAELVKEVRITYEQDGKLLVEKTEEDCTIEEKTLSVRLTQEDTLKFSSKKKAELQVRILTTNGTALATEILKLEIEDVLNEEVLT